MYKVKQIDYDKMLALLQLGIAADSWTTVYANRAVILEILARMGVEDVKRVSDFYMGQTSNWVKGKCEDGSISCYTLVDSDEED